MQDGAGFGGDSHAETGEGSQHRTLLTRKTSRRWCYSGQRKGQGGKVMKWKEYLMRKDAAKQR